MTQVKEWSNQELNRKLAELMGYKMHIYDDGTYGLLRPDGTSFIGRYEEIDKMVSWLCAPSYCTDPAASLEVQAAACKVHFDWYIQALSKVVGADGYWDSGALDYKGIKLLLTATPRERSEAAYKTLSSQVSV